VRSGTAALYYRRDGTSGDTFKVDGFVGRSLFDLYSNFTFLLNEPSAGDAIQQHDSRLQEGANLQYLRPHRLGFVQGLFTGGGKFHDNQINVGLYPRKGSEPTGVTTRANARVSNGAGYVQESLTFFHGKLLAGGGLQFDEFRFDVKDRVDPALSGLESGGRWQPKGSLAFTPTQHSPHLLRQLRTRHFDRRRARGGAASRTRADRHYGFLSTGNIVSPRPFFNLRQPVLDRSLERAGLHPRRRHVRVQGSEPRLRF